MYGYPYPMYCCPGNAGYNNGVGSGWIWAIIIVVIIIFFLFSGDGARNRSDFY